MRPEIEKAYLAQGPDQETIELLEGLSGTFLELEGGVGIASEYLANKGNKVTLQDSNRLSFSYRGGIVPNSAVTCWAIDITEVRLDKPAFDYVLIRNDGLRERALKIAKKAVINLAKKTIESKNAKDSAKPVNNPKDSNTKSEIVGTDSKDPVLQSDSLRSREQSEPDQGNTDISNP
jgi:hypothetical protein